MIRKILPTFLVGGSIAIAALIFFTKTPGQLATPSLDQLIASSNEQVPKNSPVSTNAIGQQNAVQAIASGISEEIINNNPDGPQNFDNQMSITATDPNTIAEKLIQGGETIDYSKFDPKINLSDLHILPVSDKNLAESYLQRSESITEKNFSGISSDFSKATPDDIKKIVTAYNQALNELYSLTVPANLAEIHTEKIRLFTIERNLFQNISDYQSDPLAALVSIKMLGKAYDDLNALSQKVADFAVQNHLNI